MTKIVVTEPVEIINGVEFPYRSRATIAVKVTTPCSYCGKSVTYMRGAVFSGTNYDWECHVKSGNAQREAEAFKKFVLGDMTPNEYQAKHGRAWNG